jgi:hypothetical protein
VNSLFLRIGENLSFSFVINLFLLHYLIYIYMQYTIYRNFISPQAIKAEMDFENLMAAYDTEFKVKQLLANVNNPSKVGGTRRFSGNVRSRRSSSISQTISNLLLPLSGRRTSTSSSTSDGRLGQSLPNGSLPPLSGRRTSTSSTNSDGRVTASLPTASLHSARRGSNVSTNSDTTVNDNAAGSGKRKVSSSFVQHVSIVQELMES